MIATNDLLLAIHLEASFGVGLLLDTRPKWARFNSLLRVEVIGDFSNLPLLRNPPQRRFLVELWRFAVRRAQLAVGVDATGQQVVQQALLDGLELVDQRLGFADGAIESVEDSRDCLLLWKFWSKAADCLQHTKVDPYSC
ncbi:hypothetical protein D3C78_1413940 [compost metagenome]